MMRPYYSSKFARAAQIIRERIVTGIGEGLAKAQRRQGFGDHTETLKKIFIFMSELCAFASLREIFRAWVAALPRWDLRGEWQMQVNLPTV